MNPFLNKTICCLLLISSIGILNTHVQTALATSQTSRNISSFGTISPSTPTPPPNNDNLPLTGFADDYTITYSSGSPDIWASKLGYFTKWNMNTARMSFTFANDPGGYSVYDKAKMNTVLGYLDSVGVKAVLCYFAQSAKYGSQQWVDNWKRVAQDFKGDSRIRAFQLLNEAYVGYLSSTGPTGGIIEHDLASFNRAYAYLIDQVRAIDPSRTIMYPLVMGIVTGSWTDAYNSMVAHGIPAKGNMLYDITHPYFFENEWDGGMTPEQRADWYLSAQVMPAVNAFGAENCWCGETYPAQHWPDIQTYRTLIPANRDLQVRFVRRLVSNLADHGVGFQILCYFSANTYVRDMMDECLATSHYYALYG